MKRFRQCAFLMAAGLLLSTGLFAQDGDDKQKERSAKPPENSMTGCLAKDSSGVYMLTDSAGTKIAVAGAQDLEKHSANHTVTLTGKMSTDSAGKPVFEVSKIQHVADTCKAPPQ